jgi:hypothetical protein
MSSFKMFRQYTMSDIDSWNFYNGRCPNYALSWSDDMNEQYWGVGYDFIVGNKKELVIDSSLEDGYQSYLYALREQYKKNINLNIGICCRFEDVLCRWDSEKDCWVLNDGAMELWEAIRFYSPSILISCGETCVRGGGSSATLMENNIINKKVEFCEKMFPERYSIIIDMEDDVCQVIYNGGVFTTDKTTDKKSFNIDSIYIEHPCYNDCVFGIKNDIVTGAFPNRIIHTCNRETFRALRMKGVEIFWAV